MNQIVHARFNPFDAETFRFEVARGLTVAEIIAACGPDVPSWFWFEDGGEVQINGVPIARAAWRECVPTQGDVITFHAVIHGGGGGGGGSTKRTATIVAAVALAAAATLVSAGAAAPLFAGTALAGSFAAGGLGAILGGAALATGAAVLMATLTPPPMPVAQEEAASDRETGGGISANTVRPLDTLPAVLGKMRYSPPLLAPPYTTFTAQTLTLHAIVGLAGEYDQATLDASILINGVSPDEFDQATIEKRYGTLADAVLTICTDTVIEDIRNATLSNVVLKSEQDSQELEHQSDPDRDLSQWAYYKTAGDADEIRIRLLWPAGIADSLNADTIAHMPIRTEIRERGSSTWKKLPPVHFQDFRKGRASMRKEILIKFVDALPGIMFNNYDEVLETFAAYKTTNPGDVAPGTAENLQYDADAYFDNTAPADAIPDMTGATTSGVTMSASNETGTRQAWMAADDDNATWWQVTSGTAYPHWLKVRWGATGPKTIKSFMIRGPDGVGNEVFAPGAFTLQGSNDNFATAGVILGTYDERGWAAGQSIWFQVETPGSYADYRLHVTENSGNTGTRIVTITEFRLSLADAPGANTNAVFASHANLTGDGVEFYLLTSSWPKGEYEVRIKRGMADQKNSNFDPINYANAGGGPDANFFSYQLGGGVYSVTSQEYRYGSQCIIEQFATVENVYPFDESIHTKGVCMIAIEGENLTINSLSAIFHSVAPVYSAGADWSLDAATSNPSALRRHVLLGHENALALPGEILNEPQHIDFYEECETQGHEFNAVVDGLTVAQVVQQIDAGGYGLAVYPSAQWGVIFEHDRSAEDPVQVFTPLNTRSLTVSRDFAKLPQAFRVQHFDEDQDYDLASPEPIVYADGFDEDTADRIETLELPGFTNSAKAQARALFDIRQLYLRNARYSFEIGIEGLVAERGDLVGLNHDVISRYHDFARIKSITTLAGNVTGLVLEARVNLAVAAGEVTEAMSAVMQLTDRTLLIKPVNELAETDTITFAVPFAAPATLKVGAVVGFGVVDSETRRCLVHTIEYIDLFTRRISLVDEAPALHA